VYLAVLGGDDVGMVDVDVSGEFGAVPRRRRSAVERRRVVEETLEAGASVARVALKHGVNANQVFQWRRLYWDGKLGVADPMSRERASDGAMRLLPVSVSEGAELAESEPVAVSAPSSGAIHIELSGEVRIRLEGSVDPAMVRAVLESLRS
jgi:transposase